MRPNCARALTALLLAPLLLAPLVLAQEMPAPEIEVAAPAEVAVGEVAEARYTLTWTGHAPLVLPPETVVTAWGAVQDAELNAVRQGDGLLVTYRLRVLAEQQGTHTWPGLEFAYTTPEEWAAAEQDPDRAPMLRVAAAQAAPLRVSEPIPWLALSVVLAVLVAGGAVVLTFVRLQQRRRTEGDAPARAARAHLEAARQRKLEGDTYACYGALLAALDVLPKAQVDDELRQRLEQRRQAVGYRGEELTNQAVEHDLRAVEQALSQPEEQAA